MQLVIQDLVSGYGEDEVLHGLSLEVGEREAVAVLGPNGAGKTTLLKSVVGLIKPRKGKVLFRGEDLTGGSPDEVLRKGICYVPQGGVALAQMTVRENLELGGYIVRDRATVKERMRKVLDFFPSLEERRNVKAGLLSGGERQMLAIGRALMLEPSLMMFDEPSVGLAPKIASLIFAKIREMNSNGTTILLIEQNAKRALEVTSRAYIVEAGQIKGHDSSQELLKSEDVHRYYLGGKEKAF